MQSAVSTNCASYQGRPEGYVPRRQHWTASTTSKADVRGLRVIVVLSTPVVANVEPLCHPQDRPYNSDGIIREGLCNPPPPPPPTPPPMTRFAGRSRGRRANKICFSGVGTKS